MGLLSPAQRGLLTHGHTLEENKEASDNYIATALSNIRNKLAVFTLDVQTIKHSKYSERFDFNQLLRVLTYQPSQQEKDWQALVSGGIDAIETTDETPK